MTNFIPPLKDVISGSGKMEIAQNNKVLRDTFRTISNGGLTGENLSAAAGINAAQLGNVVWTSYTPTLTASVTNPSLGSGVADGEYILIGGLVIVAGSINASGTVSAGSGTYQVALPVEAAARRSAGVCVLFDNSTNTTQMGAMDVDTSSSLFTIWFQDGGHMTSANPFALDSGDFIWFTGLYQKG